MIEVFSQDSWYQTNKFFKRKFLPLLVSNADEVEVGLYKGLAHACYESCFGLGLLFAHKKSVGFISGQTFAFRFLLPQFQKQLYKITECLHEKLTGVDGISGFVNALPVDTLFVLFAEDHPVTGEVYSFVHELDKKLNERKIYSLRISHNYFKYQQEEILPMSAKLCSLNDDLSVMISGKRFRKFNLLSENMNWNSDILNRIQIENEENKNLVLEFESRISEVCAVYFTKEQQRIYDRSVFYFEDVNAQAIISELNLDNEISTTNLCFWKPILDWNTWWVPGLSDIQQRGLMVVGLKNLLKIDIVKKIKEAHLKVLEKQKW